MFGRNAGTQTHSEISAARLFLKRRRQLPTPTSFSS